jgi:hypothetical protein
MTESVERFPPLGLACDKGNSYLLYGLARQMVPWQLMS